MIDVNVLKVGDSIRGIIVGNGSYIYHNVYTCRITDMTDKKNKIHVIVTHCDSDDHKWILNKIYMIHYTNYDKMEYVVNTTKLSKLINEIYIKEKEEHDKNRRNGNS